MTKTKMECSSDSKAILKRHIKKRLKKLITKETLEKFTNEEIVTDLINQINQAKKENFFSLCFNRISK